MLLHKMMSDEKEIIDKSIDMVRTPKSKFDIDDTQDEKVCMLRTRKSKISLLYDGIMKFLIAVVLIHISSTIFQNLFGINKFSSFYFVGCFVSLLTTYYKFRIWINPNFKSDCGCEGGDTLHGILSVIDHKKGSILFGIPNSVFGILYYGFMLAMTYIAFSATNDLRKFASLFTVCGSLYLWFTMIFQVGFNCVLCITLHAVNYLTFCYYFF